MKYMIMLYGSQQDYDVLAGKPTDKPPMSPEEIAAMHEHMGSVHERLAESGELIDAQGLSAPVHARRVRRRSGVPAVTDGPYAETTEVLAGYTLVDCVSFDRATEIAVGMVDPDDEASYVDVRPVIEGVDELEV
jgi:hypothetical protein